MCPLQVQRGGLEVETTCVKILYTVTCENHCSSSFHLLKVEDFDYSPRGSACMLTTGPLVQSAGKTLDGEVGPKG